MTDSPPDRCSIDPKSPFYSDEAARRGVGVRFKTTERFNVAEYCLSEGWVRFIPAGGSYRNTVKIQGPVAVWWRS